MTIDLLTKRDVPAEAKKNNCVSVRAVSLKRPVQKLTSFSLKHYQIIFGNIFSKSLDATPIACLARVCVCVRLFCHCMVCVSMCVCVVVCWLVAYTYHKFFHLRNTMRRVTHIHRAEIVKQYTKHSIESLVESI